MSEANPKQEYIKECLYDATMQLMASKSLNDITVTELTARAGVSRMAFYRNFNIVQDVIKDKLDSSMMGLKNFVNGSERNSIATTYDIWLFISSLLTFIHNNSDLMRNLIRSDVSYILINWMNENFSGKLSDTVNDFGLISEYDRAAFTGMLYQISVVYAKSPMDDDSRVEAASALYRVIYNYTHTMNRAAMHLNHPKGLTPLKTYNALGSFTDDITKEYAVVYMMIENDKITHIGAECSENSILRACMSAAMSLVIDKSTLSALTLTLDDVSAELDGLLPEQLYHAAIACATVKNAGIDHYNRRNLNRSRNGVEALAYEWDWTIKDAPETK